MAKYAEDFTAATWDKNGGACSVTGNSTAAPDGHTTADTITAVAATPVIQQQIARLASGGQYTFYVWGKVASGTKQVDNAYAGYLAGPTSITLTTAWSRFKITGIEVAQVVATASYDASTSGLGARRRRLPGVLPGQRGAGERDFGGHGESDLHCNRDQKLSGGSAIRRSRRRTLAPI